MTLCCAIHSTPFERMSNMIVCSECGDKRCPKAVNCERACQDEDRSDLDQFHIVPVNDLCDHEASRDCFCKPIQDEEEPTVFIHNSLDGREAFEAGKRLVS